MAELAAANESIAHEEIYATLRMTMDPLYAVSILEMGMLAQITVAGSAIAAALYQPYPDKQQCDALLAIVAAALLRVNGCTTSEATFLATPRWDTSMMSPRLRQMFGFDDSEPQYSWEREAKAQKGAKKRGR